MRRWGAGRRGRGDEANLMLLAGIIVTIAFILTALTLEQVASLQRAAASDTPTTISKEWRFIHDRLVANLNTSFTPDLKDATFRDATLPAITSTFRTVEAEKGYDITLRLASDPTKVNRTEADLLNVAGTQYTASSIDGAKDFTGIAYDNANDGLLHHTPCDDPAAATCVQGVLLSVHMSDGTSTMEEVMLFYVNRP